MAESRVVPARAEEATRSKYGPGTKKHTGCYCRMTSELLTTRELSHADAIEPFGFFLMRKKGNASLDGFRMDGRRPSS